MSRKQNKKATTGKSEAWGWGSARDGKITVVKPHDSTPKEPAKRRKAG